MEKFGINLRDDSGNVVVEKLNWKGQAKKSGLQIGDIIYVENVNKAIDIFEEEKVQVIIHAGDIISPPIVKEFKKLTDEGVEFFGIFGNNDGEKRGLENAFSYINGELLGDEGKIEIDGLKFCIYHGQDLKKKEKIINSQKFDVFIFGHSHTKYHEIIQNKKI